MTTTPCKHEEKHCQGILLHLVKCQVSIIEGHSTILSASPSRDASAMLHIHMICAQCGTIDRECTAARTTLLVHAVIWEHYRCLLKSMLQLQNIRAQLENVKALPEKHAKRSRYLTVMERSGMLTALKNNT